MPPIAPDELDRIAKAEDNAEAHMKRTGTITIARAVRRPDGVLSVVYDIRRKDDFVYTLGVVEAVTAQRDYNSEELRAFTNRWKSNFPHLSKI